VDDEYTFRKLARDYLVDKGYFVILAENGVEGLKKLAEAKIDLVISDLHMHVMDGLKFCKTARDISGFEEIPFIFISAYGDPETLASINETKNSAYLSKGRPISELLSLILHFKTTVVRTTPRPPAIKAPGPKTEGSPTPIRAAGKSNPQPKKSGPYDILVVDDDDALRQLMEDILSREGYQVTTAADGDLAIKLLKNKKFDLVLLDIIMPNVSGFGVLKYISENNITAKVIMISAYQELKLAVEGKDLGAADFLCKPFMRPDLLNTIRGVLSQ